MKILLFLGLFLVINGQSLSGKRLGVNFYNCSTNLFIIFQKINLLDSEDVSQGSFALPLITVGVKSYYVETFFKVNFKRFLQIFHSNST